MEGKSSAVSDNNCYFDFLELQPCNNELTDAERTINEQCSQIENARTAFLQNCFFGVERPLVNQQRLINKPAFIINYIEGIRISDGVFSLLCDRQTLFSEEYVNYSLDHEVMRENRKIAGSNSKERHQMSAVAALAEYKRMRPKKYEQNRDAFEDTLNKIDRYRLKCHNSIHTCYKKLSASIAKVEDGQEAKPLLTVLKSWDPNIQLDETNVLDFFVFTFATYRQKYVESLLVEMQAGHYAAEYTLNDYLEFQEYEKRKNACIELFSSIKKWAKEHHFPFDRDEKNDAKHHFPDEVIEKISQLLQEYLQTTRSVVKTPEKRYIVKVLQFSMVQERFSAFRFLVLCIGGSGAIFNSGGEDWYPIFSGFTQHIYRAKPAHSTQRIERLKLLCGLCNELQMDSTAVQDNLLYFLVYHGFEILSEKEASIWNEVLERYNLQKKPASLALRCWDYLHRCLPFSSANLFCYQSCSQLHLNGFLAFCKAFPRSVSGPSGLLRTIPDDLTNWYLSEWGSYQPDISAIQEKCRHESSIIKETAAMKKWVKQWDSESKEGKHKVPYPIDWDELRTLLLECAIRRKIINQTQTKLQRQLFNRILNRLQISVQ